MSSPLKIARVARGITQRQLSRSVGLDTTTFCLIEAGDRRPSRAVAERIAYALGIDADHLFPDGFTQEGKGVSSARA